MDTDSRPININDYNSSDGKLKASIKWLITRIYEEKDIPDNLRDLFFVDDKEMLQLLPIVVVCLQNGSLYTQASSKILQNNSLINGSISSVLCALSSVGIEAREADGGYVTEDALSENPLKINTHLALIDALMIAHLKSVVSIERVVQAISSYTTVDKREEPLDNVDALLFWINKICLLVRDDVERNDIVLESNGQGEATIPEMEDLYEDMCDGCAVSVLLAFYRGAEVPLHSIYFNDPMSINDCRYNLNLIKNFCENALPWNAFHFEVEDILYLHESLQPNVNVFLADLFYFFELQTKSIPEPVVVPVQRSRSPHPPKVNRFSHGSSQRDRTISAASVDSLMTSRSGDSLKYASKQANYIANPTHFGEIQTAEQAGRNMQPVEDHHSQKSSAEVKLQMEDFRRQLERNKMIRSAMNEENRTKLGKDAFFKVMSKSTNEEDMSRLTNDAPAEEILNQQVHSLQEQIDHLKLSQSPAQQFFGPQSHPDLMPVAHNIPGGHPLSQNLNHQFGGGQPAVPYNMSSSALLDGHNLNNNRHPLNAVPYATTVNTPTAARFMQQQQQQSYDQANYALPQTALNSQNYIPSPPYTGGARPGDQPPGGGGGNVFQASNNPTFPMHSSTSQPNALNLIQQSGQQQQFFGGQGIQQPSAYYQQPTSKHHYTTPYANNCCRRMEQKYSNTLLTHHKSGRPA
uniref:Calponin-homology (CH) domain-containing protein n=1 Tax=Ditylenchus dipsaci TaxID=166011 RepID=A0A915CNH0_9BILA